MDNMSKTLRRWVTFAGCVLVVVVLYWAQAVLVPIALAILLTFVLTPPVTWFQRWIGRIPATAGIAHRADQFRSLDPFDCREPGRCAVVVVSRLNPVRFNGGDIPSIAGVERRSQLIAPSSALRVWFDHDPDRWRVFRQKYLAELDQNEAGLNQLLDLAATGRVTLYAAHDESHDHAVVLCEYIMAAARARPSISAYHRTPIVRAVLPAM
jgi:uncharacterized protein YeaO (DUF488 family)